MDSNVADLFSILAGAIVAPVGFVAWWAFVCFVLGLVSGWRGLADEYGTQEPAPPNQETFLGGSLGWINHRGTLQLGATPEALDLRVMVLFRPGHPPLRIPWDDIVDEGDGLSLFITMAKLRLGRHGPVLRIRRDVWERVIDINQRHVRAPLRMSLVIS